MSKDYSKRDDFKNPDAPATRRQTWALFCMTKQDWREKNLTVFEASQLIDKLKRGESIDGVKGSAEVKLRKAKFDAVEISKEAEAAGEAAGAAVTPQGMIVQQHVDMTDDNSPVAKQWAVPEGPCGFAWVVVRCKNSESRSFINQLKKLKIATSDVNEHNSTIRWRPHYNGGFAYWVHYGNQSYDRKTAYAAAFAEVLCKYGINAYSGSRLD